MAVFDEPMLGQSTLDRQPHVYADEVSALPLLFSVVPCPALPGSTVAMSDHHKQPATATFRSGRPQIPAPTSGATYG